MRSVPVIVLVCAATLATAVPRDGYRLLREIRSPLEMARHTLPHSYRAELEVSGPVVDHMRASMTSQNLEPPRFVETSKRPGVFNLQIANESYPLDTREMLSGILNPADLIDVVLTSLMRFRDEESFDRLRKETTASVAPAPSAGPQALAITLIPVSNRFGYTYDDRGTLVSESWLRSLRAEIDTVDFLLHKLELVRSRREYSIEEPVKPPLQELLVRYEITYTASAQGVPLPSELQLFINDTLILEVSAGYRREKQYTVFDNRRICSYTGAAAQCLEMKYVSYQFGSVATPRAAASDAARTRRIQKASELSRKAQEQMRIGEIKEAFRTLQRLALDFAETPQGLEAIKLLDGLPRGL